ncbi:Uncharacterised protein [Streptococcus dysgalactiae]|uniref:Uncharacterized protein n=1 Tax=Streptococcus dysgalactiae TaxID=1334 RepID=A0A9X9SHL4_STRDY|nr:Uncharacterised protein [Streptococcus dysgalactiae]
MDESTTILERGNYGYQKNEDRKLSAQAIYF